MTNSNETENAVRPVAVLILPEWKANIDLLTDDRQVARVMRAFVDYTIGVEADLSDDVELRQFWHGTVLPKLRDNRSRYLATCDERSNAGKLSGESRRRKAIEKKEQNEQNEQVFDFRTKRTKRTSATNSNCNSNCKSNLNTRKRGACNDGNLLLDIGVADNSNDNPGHSNIAVNWRKWTHDEFLRSVDDAIAGHPELSRYRAGFIRHWWEKKTTKGLPAFKDKQSWSTLAQLQEWSENPWNNAGATNPATPAGDGLSVYDKAQAAIKAHKEEFNREVAAEAEEVKQ